jgi:hypothetical protein
VVSADLLARLVDRIRARSRTGTIRGGVASGKGPLRFSLTCLGFSFLFRGVQRGYFSFQRERSEIMKADELLISAEEFP